MEGEPRKVLTIPGWEKIPFLVHGFGNRNWKYSDFRRNPVLRKFKPIFLRQIHSDIAHIVRGFSENKKSGDALLTDRPGLLLVIKTADCLPVLMTDKNGRAVAGVHCGWRSTSQRLVQKVVDILERSYGCEPSSLMVAFGPSIGGDCYEVGEDVKNVFEKKGLEGKGFSPHPRRKDKLFLDLRLSNRYQLQEKGVSDSNVFEVDMCTHCDKEFLSYRRDRETKGRMLSFIGFVS